MNDRNQEMMRDVMVGIALMVLILFGLLALATRARAHDHEHPELNDWYKGLHSRGGAWCCNGDDAKNAEDWSTQGDHYRVWIAGEWVDVPDGAIVDGQNRAGQAKVWFYLQSPLGGKAMAVVRCFMPGTMT